MDLDFSFLSYQRRLWKAENKYLGLIGGTGCGKTWFLPRWLFLKMIDNPDEEWIVSAPTILMLKRNPIKYLTDFFNTQGIRYTFNKSELLLETRHGIIYCISADNPDRMQGIHARGIVGDEAGLYSGIWWETAVQRVSFKKGQIMLLTTPYAMNWLKSEFWDNHVAGNMDFYVENPASTDNPFYPEDEYNRAKERLPSWKFEMLYNGKFRKPAGLIYPEYEIVKPFDIPSHWYISRGVDFGYNNPFGVIWLAEDQDTGTLYAFREYKQSGMNIDAMYEVLNDDYDVQSYGDPGGGGKEIIETFSSRGIAIVEAKKDVMAGILLVNSYLQSGRLKVFETLTHTIDELDTYQWEVDKTETILDKPRKYNDHLMDALRYCVFSQYSIETRANEAYTFW
jgi:PBSX family phage terminase large subunit